MRNPVNISLPIGFTYDFPEGEFKCCVVFENKCTLNGTGVYHYVDNSISFYIDNEHPEVYNDNVVRDRGALPLSGVSNSERMEVNNDSG